MENNYILVSDGELYHWKYKYKEKLPNGKWRYYYNDYYVDQGEDYTPRSERPIGQNYITADDKRRAQVAKEYAAKQREAGRQAVEKRIANRDAAMMADAKVGRFFETAKVYVNNNLSRNLIDILQGKNKTDWEDAKRWVDYMHRSNDKYPKWN